MDWLTDPQIWLGLLTLTALEIVLGIDNIVFISVLAEKLPASSQPKARFWGLALAMIMRVLLLLSLSWIMGLTRPLFTVSSFELSGRALILIVGGLFLIAKSTREIHHNFEEADESGPAPKRTSFSNVLIAVALHPALKSLTSDAGLAKWDDKLRNGAGPIWFNLGRNPLFLHQRTTQSKYAPCCD
jgi:predicted tellurium resistance membrane protein TerC